mgnify:CR=1 FL=1|jgi:predicted transcriptional regulator
MSKNYKITRDRQSNSLRDNAETIKVKAINREIKKMVESGLITQEFADENRNKLVELTLNKLP